MVDASGDLGTIDLTDLVSAMTSSFITYASGAALAALIAIPGFGWLGTLPIISDLAKWGINWLVKFVSNLAMTQIFFLNTAIRKSSQSQDFVNAVAQKNNLPPTATDDEYAKAEAKEILEFTRFVLISN